MKIYIAKVETKKQHMFKDSWRHIVTDLLQKISYNLQRSILSVSFFIYLFLFIFYVSTHCNIWSSVIRSKPQVANYIMAICGSISVFSHCMLSIICRMNTVEQAWHSCTKYCKLSSVQKLPLKGVWHEIFDFRFFHKSLSPGPMSIPLGPFQIFFENWRRYSWMNVYQRCQRHGRKKRKILK